MKIHLLLVALVCITACTPAQQQPIDELPESEVIPPTEDPKEIPDQELEQEIEEIIDEQFIEETSEELFTDDDFLWIDDIEDVEIGELI